VVGGDFDGSDDHDLAIGAPGEDIGSEGNAGLVNVIYSNGASLDPSVEPDEVWAQDGSLGGDVEAGDRFGAALG
jgi:hypothetical protein